MSRKLNKKKVKDTNEECVWIGENKKFDLFALNGDLFECKHWWTVKFLETIWTLKFVLKLSIEYFLTTILIPVIRFDERWAMIVKSWIRHLVLQTKKKQKWFRFSKIFNIYKKTQNFSVRRENSTEKIKI